MTSSLAESIFRTTSWEISSIVWQNVRRDRKEHRGSWCFKMVTPCSVYLKRKKTILGLNTGMERIHMKLDGDGHTLLWKLHDSIKDATRIEVHSIHAVHAYGEIGFTVMSHAGDVLLDVEADSEEIRDTWVTHLQWMCEDSNPNDETEEEVQSGSKLHKIIEDRAKKQRYWAKRTQELERRKSEAEERKKKFAGVGMKYTALAMSNRPAP